MASPPFALKKQELIEVAEVVVAMSCRPHEQVGARRRAADHQVGVTGVVGQEVESHDLVRARRHAAVLHVMVVRREGLRLIAKLRTRVTRLTPINVSLRLQSRAGLGFSLDIAGSASSQSRGCW